MTRTRNTNELYKGVSCILIFLVIMFFLFCSAAFAEDNTDYTITDPNESTRPALITDRHIRYIQGPGDGLFYPNNSITRAETVKLLNNILSSSELGPLNIAFYDVNTDKWFADPIRFMSSWDMIHGYPDGTFRPSGAVTRAEFVTMLVNITGSEETSTETEQLFTDITESWAYTAINTAVNNQWIFGYSEPDGTFSFRPDRNISRAEAVTILNRVLGRDCDINVIEEGTGILHFPDVQPSDWFYPEIMEACIGHMHEITDTGEVWTDYSIESTGLSMGIHYAAGLWFFINENGQPKKYSAGYYLIDQEVYHARSDGYALYRETEKGLITIDGKHYLGNGTGLVAGKTGWYDFNGYTYYFHENGTIAVDETILLEGDSGRLDEKGRRITRLRSLIENCRTAAIADQIVLTVDHTLTFWCKAEDSSWRKLMETYCGYGTKGLTNAEERTAGSYTTPAGAFPLTLAFGKGADPGTGMPYKQITKYSYWSDATNDWTESRNNIKGEHLIDYDQYKYAVAIGFNIDPYIPSKGSAIFLHCKSRNSWKTAGCISLKEEDMLSLMKMLNEGAYIIIVKDTEDIINY